MFQIKGEWSPEYVKARKKAEKTRSSLLKTKEPLSAALDVANKLGEKNQNGFRTEEIVLARKVLMYLCRMKFNMSLEEIRLFTGCYDTEEVLSGINLISTKMQLSPEFRGRITKFLADYERRYA